MTEAYAAKNIKGDIVQLYMTKPASVPFPLTCVPVAVIEKGDALKIEDAGDYYVIPLGNMTYIQRKGIKTGTDQPLSDAEKVIVLLCAYLSRGPG